MQLRLGKLLDEHAAATLPARALLGHVMALGATGSGKTVFCKVLVEEAVIAGVPVICVDPQGDLASLALAGGDRDSGDPSEFHRRADVVVFTPASRKGVALCADPLGEAGASDAAAAEEALAARSRAAATLVALLGYDLDSDHGGGLRAVLDAALGDLAAVGRPALRLEHLGDYLDSLDDSARARYGRYVDARTLRNVSRRLARLDVGARRSLFHDGLPIDIDLLLGRAPSPEPEIGLADAARGGRRALEPGKTRVSVIYLNTLHDQADKEFFVAALVDRLYAWMLRNPSPELQALFYIDEVAPFVPPVRKPACKPGIELLCKQARKYGVGCVMATQNPGDVDYKAMAQFGTWALGRLTTRQDLNKIAPVVRALAPDHADAILAAMPARRPGQLTLLAPDHLAGPQSLETRRLHSAHQTLDGWPSSPIAAGASASPGLPRPRRRRPTGGSDPGPRPPSSRLSSRSRRERQSPSPSPVAPNPRAAGTATATAAAKSPATPIAPATPTAPASAPRPSSPASSTALASSTAWLACWARPTP